MSGQKFERVTNKTLNTPATARHVAQWSLDCVHRTEKNSYYGLITARVFTAFMFEGTLQRIGGVICRTWSDDRIGNKKPLEKSPIGEQHKFIRHTLSLSNSTSEFRDLAKTIRLMIEFRNHFAHPKYINAPVLREIIEESDRREIPDVVWENEVKLEIVEHCFKKIEKYSIDLLDLAADFLDKESQEDWKYKREKYAHLPDMNQTAIFLRAFLTSSFFSSSSTRIIS